MCRLAANATEPDFKSKDWVFLNYTYKRFEGLTQRGTIPTYMKAGKAWQSCGAGTDVYGHRVGPRSPAAAEGSQPLRIHLTLVTTYLGLLQERQELGNEGALPHYLGCLYIVYTRAVFSHSSQASSITRTLKSAFLHVPAAYCFWRGDLLPKGNIGNEDRVQIICTVSTLVSKLALMQT